MSSLMIDIYTPTGYGTQSLCEGKIQWPPGTQVRTIELKAPAAVPAACRSCGADARRTPSSSRATPATAATIMRSPKIEEACEIPFAECSSIRIQRSTAISTRAGLLFLLGGLPREVHSRAGEVSRQVHEERRRTFPKARSTPARCIRRSGRSVPALVRSAAWRWSPSLRRPKRAPIPN